MNNTDLRIVITIGVALAMAVPMLTVAYWPWVKQHVFNIQRLHDIKLFSITFFLVGLFNQAGYNFCMKSHCLSAAFPKVLFISLVICSCIWWVKRQD